MMMDTLNQLLTLVLTPWGLGILGLCVGSFLNVVVHRLPKMLEARWQADAAEVLGQTAAANTATTEPISLS